jgi:hypothetical protein
MMAAGGLFTLQELEADGGVGRSRGSGALSSLIGLDAYRALFGDTPLQPLPTQSVFERERERYRKHLDQYNVTFR